MTYSPEKIRDEEKKVGLDDLRKLGVEVPKELEDEIEETIAELGDEFFRKIESGNNLYWTFSPFGEEIIKSGKVLPGVKTPTQVTEGHSRGVHFTKPDIDARYALGDINYVEYAKLDRRLGYGGHPIHSIFGTAVAFPVHYLASVTPYRQVPLEERMDRRDRTHQTEQDIVFFNSDERESAYDYEYDLKEAYVYIIPKHGMRDDPRFKDIFKPENLRRMHAEGVDPVYEVAKIIFREYGYSDEWISKHVIPLPIREVLDGEEHMKRNIPDIARLTLATRKAHSMIGNDRSIVIPTQIQKDRALESTDDSFMVQQSQLEKLAVIPIKRE